MLLTLKYEEAGEPKCNAQAEGDSVFHDQPVTNEISDQGITNRGTAENGDRRRKILRKKLRSGKRNGRVL